MNTYNIAPISPLRPFLKNIWIIEHDGRDLHNEKMTPFGCMDLVFIHKNRIQVEASDSGLFGEDQVLVSGQITQPYHMKFEGETTIVGFGFYPHTAHLMLGLSAHHMTDRIVRLEEVLRIAKSLEESLATITTLEEKIQEAQNFILEQIDTHYCTNSRARYLTFSLRKIVASKGTIDIGQLAKELNCSTRYIQNLFKEYVGISPRLYGKVIKFMRTLDHKLEQHENFTDLGLKMGYFDQSHFIRDFKRFTGLTPTSFFKENHYILDQVSNENGSLLYNLVQ